MDVSSFWLKRGIVSGIVDREGGGGGGGMGRDWWFFDRIGLD